MSESNLTLLNVPLKSTQEFNWAQTLATIFPLDDPKYHEIFNEIHSLRQRATNCKVLQDVKTIENLELMKKYYDQIGSLELKLGALAKETGDSSGGVQIFQSEFLYYDAFDKGSYFSGRKSISLPFLAFERLCILFNIGAYESQLAAELVSRGSDEDMKTVTKLLQTSSGIFLHLSNLVTVLPEESLTGDLNPDTLSALSGLMLAQAQEMFLTKAIKDRMKDSIIAKLSLQAEELFGDTLLRFTKETTKYQLDRSWLNMVAAKKLAYAALAQYFQAKHLATNKIFGEQIARFTSCLELLKKAQDKIGDTTFFSYYSKEGNRLLQAVTKDNDFIYHEVVPKPDKLPTIAKSAGARLAKIISVPDRLCEDFKDLFAKVEIQAPAITPVLEEAKSQAEPSSGVSTPEEPPAPKKPTITKEPPPRPPPPVLSPDKPSPTPAHLSPPSNPTNTATATSPLQKILDAPLRRVFDVGLNEMGNYLQRYLEKSVTTSNTNINR